MRKILLLFAILLAFSFLAFSQTRTVTGTVIDSAGSPIPFASVKIVGSTTTVSADAEGSFRIAADGSQSLEVSAIGYITQTVSANESPIKIVLLPASGQIIDEVVVTGYGNRSRRQSTGSVSSINTENIKNVPMGSFDQVLQGMAPGLLVTAQSGQPGSAASVQIRGKGSLDGSNTPLYIVDGIQITANDFAAINSADFESISVLKDASSTSIYGSRGANGVIVVTTKKGKSGKVVVNYDGLLGNSKFPTPKLQVMNSAEKLDYELNSNNPNGPNPFGWTDEDVARLSQINTNWQDVLFQTGRTSSHQLSASGGSERTRFYLSGSIFDQTGTVKYTGLKRYTGRFNIETGLGNFKFGLNSQFGYSKLNNTQEDDAFIGSPLNVIRWANPYEKPFDDEGNYTAITSTQPNPLQEIEENKRNDDQIKGIGNVFVEYKAPFLDGLTLRTNWGGDYQQNETNIYLAPTSYQGGIAQGNRGSLARDLDRSFRYTGTTSITYTTKIKSDHDLTVSLFNEIVKRSIRDFGFTGFGLTIPFDNEFAITPGNATNGFIPTVRGSGEVNSLLSYFADVAYGYKSKMFVNLNARRDGSSRFGSANRYANFGSVGLGYIISSEDFLKTATWINMLKLKASYGTVGNQEGIGSFDSRTLFGRAIYSGVVNYGLLQYGNPDLRWETKQMLNTGIEFALFKNRLSGSIEYYSNITKDLFVPRRVSLTSGETSISYNLGKLQNSGVDIALNMGIIEMTDFAWKLGVNFTYNKNRIKELYDGLTEQVDGLTITKVGQPINTWYMVQTASVDPANGDQLYLKADNSTTNEYDPNDKVVLGTSDAPYFGGIFNTFIYKGIELGAQFNYAMGNYIYNNDKVNLENPGYLYDNLSKNMLREWRTEGQVTDIPNPNNAFNPETTRFLEKGDFLRLRNITLAYSLPKSVLDKARLNSLRLFIQGQNLATWTKYTGFDPEISTGVLTGSQYPALKQLTFGLNIGF